MMNEAFPRFGAERRHKTWKRARFGDAEGLMRSNPPGTTFRFQPDSANIERYEPPSSQSEQRITSHVTAFRRRSTLGRCAVRRSDWPAGSLSLSHSPSHGEMEHVAMTPYQHAPPRHAALAAGSTDCGANSGRAGRRRKLWFWKQWVGPLWMYVLLLG